MSDMPKVALLVETARGYGRDVLRGIVRYARLHGPWAFYVTPGDFVQALPRMEEWGGTGIIARIATPRVARAILATRLPVVAMDSVRRATGAGRSLVAGVPVDLGFRWGRAPCAGAPGRKGTSPFGFRRHGRGGLVRATAAGLRCGKWEMRGARPTCIPATANNDCRGAANR